jgi:hypothetical protein
VKFIALSGLCRLNRLSLCNWLIKLGGSPQHNTFYRVLLWFPFPMAVQNCHISGISCETMTSFWKDTSDGPTKEFLPSIPSLALRQEPSAKVLSWDHDVVRFPTDFKISFNVKLERKHNRLGLVDLWSPSPTKDEECFVYTPGRCPSGSQEFALGAKLGLITPLPNP